MAISMRRSVKKETGKKYQQDRKKRKVELARPMSLTKIGEKKTKKIRTIGGNIKNRALSYSELIVLKGKTKTKVKIIRVLENPSNRHFVRMNILTKGTIIETDKGKVKITNRPGQQGHIQGIFVK